MSLSWNQSYPSHLQSLCYKLAVLIFGTLVIFLNFFSPWQHTPEFPSVSWPLFLVFLKCFFFQFSSVQSLSHVWLFATPWTAEHQASLSITSFQSRSKPMSIESVMPSNHLIFCRPLLLPLIFPNIRVVSNESAVRIRWPEYWSFSFNISPSNEHPGLISFRNDLL